MPEQFVHAVSKKEKKKSSRYFTECTNLAIVVSKANGEFEWESQSSHYLNILFLPVNIELFWHFSKAKQIKSFKELLADTKAFIVKKKKKLISSKCYFVDKIACNN